MANVGYISLQRLYVVDIGASDGTNVSFTFVFSIHTSIGQRYALVDELRKVQYGPNYSGIT